MAKRRGDNMPSDARGAKEPIRVLAVDDNRAVRDTLQMMFEGWKDLKLTLAENGQAAKDRMTCDSYQVVLTDIGMPKMDGLQLLEHIQREFPKIPVVMLADSHQVSTAMQAFRLGARDYLHKPIESEALRQVLDRAIATIPHDEPRSPIREDLEKLRSAIAALTPESLGVEDQEAQSEEVNRLAELLQSKLIHPHKRGHIHDIFLLYSKSGLVLADLTTRELDKDEMDLLGSMFDTVRNFMQDALHTDTDEGLRTISFGDWNILFERGRWCDMVVVCSGFLGAREQEAVREALASFETSNAEILPGWNGVLNDLKFQKTILEELFTSIDREG